MTCAIDGCGRTCRTGYALCHGHQKRKEKGQPLTALRVYKLGAWERLVCAVERYMLATTPKEESKARDLARKHAAAWLKSSFRNCP